MVHLLGLIMWRILCLGRSTGYEIYFRVKVLQLVEPSGSNVCISPEQPGHATWGRPLLLLADAAGPELNFPQNWRTDCNSTGTKNRQKELHFSVIAGQKAFQAISAGNESQTDWSLIVRSSAVYQVRRKDNKEVEAPPLKDTPCVHQCLGPTPLSVGWWKEWAAEAFICRLWLINFPNKAHYLVHTMWHSGFTFLPYGRSQSISKLSPPSLCFSSCADEDICDAEEEEHSQALQEASRPGSKRVHFCVLWTDKASIFHFFLHLSAPNAPLSS